MVHSLLCKWTCTTDRAAPEQLTIPLNKLPGSGQKKYKNLSMQSTAHGLRMDSDIILDFLFQIVSSIHIFCHKLYLLLNSLENNGFKLKLKFVKGKYKTDMCYYNSQIANDILLWLLMYVWSAELSTMLKVCNSSQLINPWYTKFDLMIENKAWIISNITLKKYSYQNYFMIS